MYDHFSSACPRRTPILHVSCGRPNPFLFIRGLSCLSQCSNIINSKLSEASYNWISYNPLPVSCGDIGFLKVA
jgi:hypothetical protein